MVDLNLNSLRTGPDSNGRFGIHGGRFVAETLMPLILEVEKSYEEAMKDTFFLDDLEEKRSSIIYLFPLHILQTDWTFWTIPGLIIIVLFIIPCP